MKAALAFLLVATAVRMGFAVLLGVAPTEAYGWICASRWAPAFFDGPGGTAGMVALAQGALDLSGIRLLWPLWAAAASWFLWRTASAVFDAGTAFRALVLWNLLPGVNIAAVTVSPTMPALALALAGVFFARRAWGGEATAWGPAALGFAGALFFDYPAILLFLGVAIAFVSVPRQRTRTNAIGLGACVLAIAAVLWGPLAWNAALEWVPLARGTVRSWIAFEWARAPFGLAGGAVGVAGAVVLAICAAMAFTSARGLSKSRFLLAVGILPLLGWIFHGLHGESALFAASAAAAMLMPLLAAKLSASRLATWGLAAGLFLASGSAARNEWQARAGWPQLAAVVREAAGEMPATEQGGFFIAEDTPTAAMLGYLLAPAAKEKYPPVFVPEGPDLSSQFALWPSYADFEDAPTGVDEFFTEQKGVNPFIGRHALYIGRELPQTVEAAFESVAPLREIRAPDGSTVTIFLCLNYQTLPL